MSVVVAGVLPPFTLNLWQDIQAMLHYDFMRQALLAGTILSVVAGLVSRPVIAVPTSVGYGANFGGLAALLGMLNSCGSGVTVVNIDNGFGAGYAASQINELAEGVRASPQNAPSSKLP